MWRVVKPRRKPKRYASVEDADELERSGIVWPCSFCHGTGFNDHTELCATCRGLGATQ